MVNILSQARIEGRVAPELAPGGAAKGAWHFLLFPVTSGIRKTGKAGSEASYAKNDANPWNGRATHTGFLFPAKDEIISARSSQVEQSSAP